MHDSDTKKFAVRLDQRRNAPKRNNRDREQATADKLKSAGQFRIPREENCKSNSEQRRPGNRTFGQKPESERNVKDPPPYELGVGRWTLDVGRLLRSHEFISAPMRNRHEQHEPYVRNRGFRMHKRLQRECENNCRPPSNLFATDPIAPGEDRQHHQRRSDRRWKTRGEIILSENLKADDLRPIGEGRFVEPKLIVKMRNDVITALDHLAR